jgi:hypothetical protein
VHEFLVANSDFTLEIAIIRLIATKEEVGVISEGLNGIGNAGEPVSGKVLDTLHGFVVSNLTKRVTHNATDVNIDCSK